MPIAFRCPPELTIAIGLFCVALAAFTDGWPLAVFGAVWTLLGVYDIRRARRRPG